MRTLFIDFDGTICTDRFWRSLEPDAQLKIQSGLFGNSKELANGWMLGNTLLSKLIN